MGEARETEREREKEREREGAWTELCSTYEHRTWFVVDVWSGLVWSGLVVTEAPPPNRSAHLGRQVDRTPREKVQKDTGPQTGGGG